VPKLGEAYTSTPDGGGIVCPSCGFAESYDEAMDRDYNELTRYRRGYRAGLEAAASLLGMTHGMATPKDIRNLPSPIDEPEEKT
jgi:hypothetical protein